MSKRLSEPSEPMMAIIRAMLQGTRYEYEHWGVRRVSEQPDAPLPRVATMDALERRGLVAYKYPRRDGGLVSRWELTEDGRKKAMAGA